MRFLSFLVLHLQLLVFQFFQYINMFIPKISLLFLLIFTILVAGVAQNNRKILRKADKRIEQYRKGDCTLFLLDSTGRPFVSEEMVAVEQIRHEFLFGCNLFWLFNPDRPIKEDEKEKAAIYSQHFIQTFNFATLPFFWASYEPKKGITKQEIIEKAVAWCKKNNITMKGHPLAWNGAREPAYLSKEPHQKAISLQLHRITEVVDTYKNKIDIWDVVNEATTYDRENNEKIAPTLTTAIQEFGVKNYLLKSFEAAKEANPDATLIINDYVRSDTYRRKVLDQMVIEGKPVFDAIGIQTHQQRGAISPQELWEICNRFNDYNVPIHFTETSFVSGSENVDYYKNQKHGKWESTETGEARQALDVVQFYTVLFSHPAVDAITWWDFSDERSWMQAPSGLLREDMSPKPAFDALQTLIREKWWTVLSAPVQTDHTVQFRGFYGDYKVTMKLQDKTISGNFNFNKESTGIIEVTLK